MIYLYSGTPGSGKSLHAASDILARLKYGGLVLGNTPINDSIILHPRGSYRYVDNAVITPAFLCAVSQEYFVHNPYREGAIKLYIDEAQLLYNCREWGKSDRAEWLQFFTQHRKFGYDVVLMAQFDRMLDRQIRSLIEYEYVHRKVGNYGAKGKVVSLLAGGGLFVAVKMWYPMRERIGAEYFRYTRKLGALYDTNALFTAPPQGASR